MLLVNIANQPDRRSTIEATLFRAHCAIVYWTWRLEVECDENSTFKFSCVNIAIGYGREVAAKVTVE